MPRSSEAAEPEVIEAETPGGLARLHVLGRKRPAGTLALGHGAGGGIAAGDLQAVAKAAVRAGWRAVLVEQPWKVAGKKVAVPPPRLDEAWLAALGALPRAGRGPLVLGGRSAGARVACRTAAELGAAGVLCLAFPLHPPGRPEKSRADELRLALGLPLIVFQGERDPFGGPGEVAEVAGDAVVAVPGDHSLRTVSPITAAVTPWLAALTA